MKVYLIKNIVTNKYYCRKFRWSEKIYNESYFTKQAAKWHRTFFLNSPIKFQSHETPKNIVIEEYEMIKI